MAEPALSVVPQPNFEVVDQVVALPVDLIEEGDRLRPVDPVWAQALAAIMKRDGQQQPIEVCRLPGRSSFLLVAGGHRLAGAKINAWTRIRAVLVDANKLDRRRRELSENLWRRDLNPLDRATFVAELIELEKARAGLETGQDGRSVSASVRWQKELKKQADDASLTVRLAYGWADDVAEQLGLSRQTIYRDLELHRGLAPSVLQRLRSLPLASNAGQLRALAKLSETDQKAIIGLIEEGKARAPSDVLGVLRQRPKPDMAKKAWSAFFGGWSRMNARARRNALRELADQGLPPGVRIVFDEAGHG